jgi:hypothetical protein
MDILSENLPTKGHTETQPTLATEPLREDGMNATRMPSVREARLDRDPMTLPGVTPSIDKGEPLRYTVRLLPKNIKGST